MECDFSGWATRANLKCSDGRTILPNAFSSNDGQTVPLVWNHDHSDPNNVLGHALLENRDEGVYAYCSFNDSESGQTAKELVQHGDVSSLSIYANKLQQNGGNVVHGAIREVSLVLAGANPGAYIDTVITHADGTDEEAAIYNGFEGLELYHSKKKEDEEEKEEKPEESEEKPKKEEKPEESEEKPKEEKQMAQNEGKTIGEVFDTLTDEQKDAVYALIGAALEGEGAEGGENMKHNVFDGNDEYVGVANEPMISHADQKAIITDAKRYGSLKESFLAHAADYGIEDIDWLFPEYQNVDGLPPQFINNEPSEWVKIVMDGVHKTPFSRIKSMYADIREDEARARGYLKGKLKKEEVFSLLKRTTDPQTVYKKQKLDRDDVNDIKDFDVVSWIKGEMRLKLDEELARAFLVGDGRLADDESKISELHIRPIINDSDLYTIKKTVTPASGESEAHALINATIRSRSEYRGSGNPVMFTTEATLADMLLLEDTTGRRIYKDATELATALRVKSIVTFPYMPSDIYAFYLNLNDYNVGADKGGSVNMFEDFDIDYNQQKYLIETRCSGAMIKPFSAVVLKKNN